jgi:hypothetical protein
MIYTHEVFAKFQSQVLAARDHCFIQGITHSEEMKIVTISNHSEKERVVTLEKSNMFCRCSCKLYESYGIPCCHIIQALQTENQNEIPLIYIMKRWEKRCKRYMSPICYAIMQISDIGFYFVGNFSLMKKVTY